MARRPKRWFRSETGWWMVTFDGKQSKLAARTTREPRHYCDHWLLMFQQNKRATLHRYVKYQLGGGLSAPVAAGKNT